MVLIEHQNYVQVRIWVKYQYFSMCTNLSICDVFDVWKCKLFAPGYKYLVFSSTKVFSRMFCTWCFQELHGLKCTSNVSDSRGIITIFSNSLHMYCYSVRGTTTTNERCSQSRHTQFTGCIQNTIYSLYITHLAMSSCSM